LRKGRRKRRKKSTKLVEFIGIIDTGGSPARHPPITEKRL